MVDFKSMGPTDTINVKVCAHNGKYNSDILPPPERIQAGTEDVYNVNKNEIHRLIHFMDVFDEDGVLITYERLMGLPFGEASEQQPVNPNPGGDEEPENPSENPENPGEGEDPENPGEGEDPENPGEGEDPENPNPGEGEDPENPGEGEDPENPGEGEDPENPGEGGDEEPEQPNPPSGGGGGQYWEDFGDLLG